MFGDKIFFGIVTPDELLKIKDIEQVPKYTIKECSRNNHHSRVDYHNSHIYGILNTIDIDKNNNESINCNFYLTATALVVVCKSKTKMIDRFISEITSEEFYQRYSLITPQLLLLYLIDKIIENNECDIEVLERSIERLEEQILNNVKKEYSREIIAKRRLIMNFKHKTQSFPYLIKSLSENENNLFNERHLKYIGILDYKADRMIDNVSLLREYASQVREAFEAETDNKTNELMKVFTVITSIFLPLTLIAGWYGMNFTTMPELTSKYGYFYVIILSIFVVISLVIYFKKKNLIK